MTFENKNYALDISKKTFQKGQIVDKDVIKQSIETILMTERYERVFEPDFGFNLSNIVFERLNESEAENLLTSIIRHVSKYENRIRVLPNACRMNINQSQHTIDINLVYVIIAEGTVDNFNRRLVF